MQLAVVRGEEVLAPIVFDVAEDRVDVVGLVLGVVVLDQEAGAGDRVVVTLARIFRASPGKGQALEAGSLDPRPRARAQLVGRALDVMADEADELTADRSCGSGYSPFLWSSSARN